MLRVYVQEKGSRALRDAADNNTERVKLTMDD
jgi:hypothetical protein